MEDLIQVTQLRNGESAWMIREGMEIQKRVMWELAHVFVKKPISRKIGVYLIA